MEIMRRKLRPGGQDVDKMIKSMGPAEVAGLLLGYENYFLSLDLRFSGRRLPKFFSTESR